METPFFRNRRWHQQPDPARNHFSPSSSFRSVPVYPLDPTRESHRPVERPTERTSGPKVVRIPVQFVGSEQVDGTGSAVKIQKVFRGFLVRKCLKKIKDIKIQVDEIEGRLSKSEVVDLVRREERERLRMSESLMSLLFKLDSICGVDFGVRVCRKAVIRKAIGLQERIDSIVAADLEGNGENADQVTEVRVSVETDNSNKSDHSENPMDSSDDSESSVENRGTLVDVSCVGGDDKAMEVEGNDGEAEIIDVGVDCEVKVSESSGACADDVCEKSDSVEEGLESVKESSSEGDEKDEKDNSVALVDGDDKGKLKEGNGGDDNKRNRELLERMMEDNEKMMSLMTQLFERNEMQTRMLTALTHRVELLEKAFVCDRLRKKKKAKTKAATTCKEN